MAFVKTSLVSGEPIVITSFDNGVTMQDVAASFESCLDLMRFGGGSHYFLIGDLSGATGAFGDILKILQYTRTVVEQTKAVLPFQFTPLFVGSDAMVKLYVDARRLQQFGSAEIALFPTLDLALSAARAQIAQTGQKDDNKQK